MLGNRVSRTLVSSVKGRRYKSIFENKNKIKDKREKYYTPHSSDHVTHIHLKEPGDNLSLYFAAGSVTLGFVCLLEGLYNMSFGKNKVSA